MVPPVQVSFCLRQPPCGLVNASVAHPIHFASKANRKLASRSLAPLNLPRYSESFDTPSTRTGNHSNTCAACPHCR